MRFVPLICASACLAIIASAASAHFPFIVADPDGSTARVLMSETLEPDPAVSIAILATPHTTFSLRSADGTETPLAVVRGKEWLTLALPGSGTRVIRGKADLGVMKRGNSTPHVLIYHPKTILGDAFDQATRLGDAAPVELVPVRADDGLRLALLIAGKPAAATDVRIITPDGKEADFITDSAGLTQRFDMPGRYAAWARHWLDESGEREGEAFEQVRHYATLVFDFGTSASASPSGDANPLARTPLPRAAASFGAVACDGWLYVYGGHIVERHAYSTASVSGRFSRLDLGRPGSAWEELPGGVAVQGMNLAAHRGKIYRVGGMEPRNDPGEPADSHSIAEAAVFDPATGQWTTLPPLPRPRSSHDVIVVGDQLLVIGGWWMKGRAGDAEWLDTMEILDLGAAEPQWRSVPQPFQRRALIVAAQGERVYVMGGFDALDDPKLDVNVFDAATNAWTSGPAIPGSPINGFSPAACLHEGSIHLSVGTGEMFRLSADGGRWEPFARTMPRVVHRMVSSAGAILVMGGAADARMLDSVEAVATADTGAAAP